MVHTEFKSQRFSGVMRCIWAKFMPRSSMTK